MIDLLVTCPTHLIDWEGDPAHHGDCWQIRVLADQFQRATAYPGPQRTPAEISDWLRTYVGVKRWADLLPSDQAWLVEDMIQRGW